MDDTGKEKKKENNEMKEPLNDAERIANIMVKNMITNMADPDFNNKREEYLQKAVDIALKKRKDSHSNEHKDS